MNRWTLVRTSLTRKPTRTGLTFFSLAIAFLLFMLLRAIAGAFAGGYTAGGVQRVFVDARYSQTDNLPLAHVHAISELDGVASITPMVWFGGYYQDPKNTFATIPVDPASVLSVFPEMAVTDAAVARFQGSRRAVLAAQALATRFGWEVGDVIPMRGNIWPKADGTWDWEFEFAGSYTVPPGTRVQTMMMVRYDYFTEAVAEWVKNQVGWAVLKLNEGVAPKTVIDTIDTLFENSADPTRSLSEDDYTRQFANQLGDIGAITTLILLAVFFTILLLSANVAALTFRERVPELAVMKTLGFADTFVALLVLAEAMALTLAGALAGIGLGFAVEPALRASLAQVLGNFAMTGTDAAQALGIALLMGLVIGLPPAWSARRLPIVQALREVH